MMKKSFEGRQAGFGLLGLGLAFISIGAMYSIELAQFSYYILIGATLLSAYYISSTITLTVSGEKIGRSKLLLGSLSVSLLLLLFGIQSPQLPFKQYTLGAGAALLAYSAAKTGGLILKRS